MRSYRGKTGMVEIFAPSLIPNRVKVRYMFIKTNSVHYVKSVQIRSIFWSVFSCIRTEYGDLRRFTVFQSKYRKIRTRKNFVFAHFSRSGCHSWCSVQEIVLTLRNTLFVERWYTPLFLKSQNPYMLWVWNFDQGKLFRRVFINQLKP